MIQLKIIDETKIDQVTGDNDSAQDYWWDKDWSGNSNRGQLASNTLNLGNMFSAKAKARIKQALLFIFLLG